MKAPAPASHRPAKPGGTVRLHPQILVSLKWVAEWKKIKDIEGDFRWLQEKPMEQEDAMSGNADKTKFSIRVDTPLVELADAYIKEGLQRNRTELIEEALRFYLGFLTAKKAEDYLLQSLSSVMSGTVQDSENRLARMDFKIAVELSKLCHVIAYTHDVDEAALSKLHLKCLEEVRHINGAVEFEDAYKYQKREV